MAYEDTLRRYLEAAIPPWKPIPPLPTDTTIQNLAAPVAAGLTSPPAPVQGPVMPASAMAGPPPSPPEPVAQAPAAPVDPLAAYQQQIADLIGGYAGQTGGVMELQKKAAERKKQVVEPALQAVETQAKAKPLPLPQQLPEPPRPDVSPRPFGTTEGKNALQAIVAGLSGIVTSLAGLRSPIGAMNAMTGAMEGWAEGDATRAAREWQKYEAEVQKMQRENAKFIEQYELARVARADDMGAAQALLQAALIREKQEDYAVQVGMTGMDQTGKIIDMAQKNLLSLQNFAHKKVLDEIKAMETQNKLATGLLTRQLLGEKVKAAKGGVLSDEAIDMMADQYIGGDQNVKQNIGRGIQGPENLVRLNERIYQKAKAQGKSGAELAAIQAEFQGFKAGQRTLGSRSANIELAINEAQALVPALRQASQNLDRSDSPLVNRFLKSMNLNLPFDEDMTAAQVQFGVALNSFINVYARAINPSGTKTVSDTEHARALLVDTWSKGAIDAGIDQLLIELNAAQQSPGKVREKLRESMAPKKQEADTPKTETPPTATTATNPKTGEKVILKDGKWQPLK